MEQQLEYAPYRGLVTHNGFLTIQNKRDGKHRTFSIMTQPDDSEFFPGKRIVSLLQGQNRETDFQSFGFVGDNGSIILWKSKRNSKDFVWFKRMLEEPEQFRGAYEYLLEGRCRVCNRTLTNPRSNKLGIGPVCEARKSK
jgi:hypothetical protein